MTERDLEDSEIDCILPTFPSQPCYGNSMHKYVLISGVERVNKPSPESKLRAESIYKADIPRLFFLLNLSLDYIHHTRTLVRFARRWLKQRADMRLPFTTFFLSTVTLLTLFPTLVSSLYPQFLSRHDLKRSPASRLVTSRQHRVVRDLLDVCINVNVDLLADASQLLGLESILGPLDLDSTTQLCLCLKDLDIYLDTSADIQAVVGLLGKDTVGSLITALVNSSPDAQQCTFPVHAHHTCNNDDPCHYECDENYVRDGDTCVCAPPYTSCNGVCDLFPQGCSSAVPRSLKPRPASIVTIAQAKAVCKSYETVCGVSGREDTLAFECVDIDSAEDSCGGCMTPHPFFEAEPSRHLSGQDCSSIPNAKNAGCSDRRCAVHTCKDGWVPSANKDACVLDTDASSKMRRVWKRSDPLSTDVTATANVASDLVSQLMDIVNMVLNLSGHSSSALPASPGSLPSSDTISSLLYDINAATASLVASPTVASLLDSVGALLDTSSLLSSVMNTCGCAQDLGLTDLVHELEVLIAAVANLQNWCAHNSIVPNHGNGATATTSYGTSSTAASSYALSTANAPDQPIVIGLTDVLSALGLKGHSGVIVSGLGKGLTDTVNNLLNGLSLGPDNFRRDDALPSVEIRSVSTLFPDSMAQMEALARIVGHLEGAMTLARASNSPNSCQSLQDPTLVPNILQAVDDLAQASDSSALLSNVDNLVAANSALYNALAYCTKNFATDQVLGYVVVAQEFALELKNWFAAQSAGTSTSVLSAITSATQSEASITGLSTSLALPTTSAEVPSLSVPSPSPSASQALKDRRQIFPPAVFSGMSNRLGMLAGIVSQLERSMTLVHASTSPNSCQSLQDPTLVSNIIQAVDSLAQSSNTSSFVSNINTLIAADSALTNALAGCKKNFATDAVLGYVALVQESALQLKSWFSHFLPSSTVVFPSITSAPLIISSATSSSQDEPSLTGFPISVVPTSTEDETTSFTASLSLSFPTSLMVPSLSVPSLSVPPLSPSASQVPSLVVPISSSSIPSPSPSASQAARITKRQIAVNTNATVSSSLLTQIDALIDLVLGLHSAGSALPPIPAYTPSPLGVASASSLVDSIVNATEALLSSSTYADLVEGVDTLVAASLDSLVALDACGCVDHLGLEQVYAYIVKVVDAALALQDVFNGPASASAISSVHGTSPTSSAAVGVSVTSLSVHIPPPTTTSVALPAHSSAISSTTLPAADEPIVLGLSKLLNGLGLGLTGGAVVDGLGDGLDHSVNSLLNGLGLGPNDFRRRVVRTERES